MVDKSMNKNVKEPDLENYMILKKWPNHRIDHTLCLLSHFNILKNFQNTQM